MKEKRRYNVLSLFDGMGWTIDVIAHILNYINLIQMKGYKMEQRKNKHLWIIDSPHGGLLNGVYQTPVKWGRWVKSTPNYYEGQTVRTIAARLYLKLIENGYDAVMLNPTPFDITRPARIKAINRLVRDITEARDNIYQPILNSYPSGRVTKYPKPVYFAPHTNGGGGTGFEVWTSSGRTPSDPIASTIYKVANKGLAAWHKRVTGRDMVFRPDWTDGDPDRENMHDMLAKTACPAIIAEYFFSDNPKDLKVMQRDDFPEAVAQSAFEAIKEVEK
jgi:N-acetylmuramoyl-L-alanine amidase